MTSATAEFLDSNVLVYAFTTDARAEAARGLLARGPLIGVQCLNEFAHVARRKLGMTWPEVRDSLSAIRAFCGTVLPLDIETHVRALGIAARHGYTMFDALVIACALEARCRVLWSEDMQHGALIDGLRISNPFRDS